MGKPFEDSAAAFHVAFSVDVATVSNGEARELDEAKKAVEFQSEAGTGAFVKHVLAVAARILRPVVQEVQGRADRARTAATCATLSGKYEAAKLAACASAEMSGRRSAMR